MRFGNCLNLGGRREVNEASVYFFLFNILGTQSIRSQDVNAPLFRGGRGGFDCILYLPLIFSINFLKRTQFLWWLIVQWCNIRVNIQNLQRAQTKWSCITILLGVHLDYVRNILPRTHEHRRNKGISFLHLFKLQTFCASNMHHYKPHPKIPTLSNLICYFSWFFLRGMTLKLKRTTNELWKGWNLAWHHHFTHIECVQKVRGLRQKLDALCVQTRPSPSEYHDFG